MNNNKKTTLFLIGILSFFLGFQACNKLDEVGYSLLPNEDKLSVIETDSTNIGLKTHLSPDSLDSYRVSKALLGAYTDPVFGKSTAEFVCELLNGGVYYFNDTMTIDSMYLYLAYSDSLLENVGYGDLTQPINFSIHKLNQVLDSTTYQSNTDISGLYNADAIYNGSFIINPKDTVLKISLPNSFAQEFMDLDSIKTFGEFKKAIPGLYFKLEGDQNKGLISFDLSSNLTRINLFFSKKDIHYVALFRLHSNFSINFNLFSHDLSGTEVLNNINSTNTDDSLVYIQSMNGSRATIEIKDLDFLKGKIINQAELILPLYANSDYINYAPINNLLLLSLKKDGNLDFLTEDNGAGSNLNLEKLNYSFNVTRYIQALANQNDSLTSTLYIVPTLGRVDYKRSIIDNRNNAVKLKIKYTK